MNRKVEIEDVIRAHPGVRDVAVFSCSENEFRAFVVIADVYLDRVLGRQASETVVVERWRKAYDLSQLSKEVVASLAGFNIGGWNSSYTRKPLSVDEMREWIEASVADIFRLRPKEVYEIGCGTGLLVTRIAPHCDRYVAADFAPAVLSRLNEQLRTLPELQNRVETLERRADNFSTLDEDSFDTVLLSSVVQYFPNLAYLTRVLERAIRIVKSGGHIYLGDIRSLPLLPVFASSVEFFQATDETTISEWVARVRRRVYREPELVLSPAYFLDLQQRFPKISRVDIRPLRGHVRNEMSCFRFQAILSIGGDEGPIFPIEFLDWNDRNWSLDEIRSTLRQYPNKSFGLKGIRNARIERDLQILARVETVDEICTVGELRRELHLSQESGIDPQDLFEIESNGFNFSVFLNWAACRHDGSYDAAFIPAPSLQGIAHPAVCWPQTDTAEFVHFANAAGQTKIRSDLVDLLKAHCLQNLPQQLIPSDITLVDFLPRSLDMQIDSCALLAACTASWWS